MELCEDYTRGGREFCAVFMMEKGEGRKLLNNRIAWPDKPVLHSFGLGTIQGFSLIFSY